MNISAENKQEQCSIDRVAVFYATREGQTQKIAEYVAGTLSRAGYSVDMRDVRAGSQAIDFRSYRFAIVAASVHRGKHEKEMVAFVTTHRAELERLPVAFLSVSLSQVGAENPWLPRERRERHAADVQGMVDTFLHETNWRPTCIKAVAGALQYRKYNLFIRFVMKQIAKRAGGATDTSRNHEYTNWAELQTFVRSFAREASMKQAGELLVSA